MYVLWIRRGEGVEINEVATVTVTGLQKGIAAPSSRAHLQIALPLAVGSVIDLGGSVTLKVLEVETLRTRLGFTAPRQLPIRLIRASFLTRLLRRPRRLLRMLLARRKALPKPFIE